MNTVPLKSWATPFVIGAFIISAVTGLLIFFDIEIGMVEPVHKWLSWLLLGSVFFHVLSNLKPFTRYFSQNAAIAVTILSLLPFFGNNDKEHDKENPGKIAVQVLESSSVKTIALVLKTTPQQLVERLGNNGIIVNNPSLTVREIAKYNGKIDKEVLGVLLQQTKASSEKNSDNN